MKLSDLIIDEKFKKLSGDLNLLREISLSTGNAVEIEGGTFEGSFKVLDKRYRYNIEALDEEDLQHFKEPLEGVVYNVSFHEQGDDPDSVYSYLRKGGRSATLKVYSTIYKVVVNLAKKEHPDGIFIAALKTSNYFPIYNELTKSNTIPGYHRKSIEEFEMDGEEIIGVLLTKNKN